MLDNDARRFNALRCNSVSLIRSSSSSRHQSARGGVASRGIGAAMASRHHVDEAAISDRGCTVEAVCRIEIAAGGRGVVGRRDGCWQGAWAVTAGRSPAKRLRAAAATMCRPVRVGFGYASPSRTGPSRAGTAGERGPRGRVLGVSFVLFAWLESRGRRAWRPAMSGSDSAHSSAGGSKSSAIWTMTVRLLSQYTGRGPTRPRRAGSSTRTWSGAHPARGRRF
jgi:hypothetical protein